LHGAPFDRSPWGGAVVEVEIDPFSLETKPVGVWLAVDGWSGTAHKGYEAQRALESSLRSGAVDALSACMREFLDPADLGSEAFAHYSQIAMTDLPRIHIDIAEARRKTTPRSFEELPFDTIPAAFLSAVSQAVCSELGTLPVRDEDLAAIMDTR
jgi:CO/xanthine dehydrogenase Mo-binding subunit